MKILIKKNGIWAPFGVFVDAEGADGAGEEEAKSKEVVSLMVWHFLV